MATTAASGGKASCPSHSICSRNSDSSSTLSDHSSSDSILAPSDSSSFSSSCSSSSAAALAQRRKHYGPNIAVSYSHPLLVERGQGCYLFDAEGRRYLDCVNNVAHVGHGNAQVAAAVSAQLFRVNTNSRYLSAELNTYIQELTDTLPHPLQVAYLVNSGSEANDLALRIAAANHAGQAGGSSSSSSVHDHVVVMSGAYHGHLSSLIPLSPYKFWGPGGGGKPDWVHVIPAPDALRSTNLDGAAAARAVLAQAATAGGRVVAFFCESIISCGGQLMLPPGYLSAVYGVMRGAGVVCIADEVQTGFGRTGVMWAFQQQGVVPDIVTLGKPMGNGFPVAGVVTTPSLAAAFANGMEYFNTYGGNNAAVAAARAVLAEMREHNLLQHAADVGKYMLSSLQQLQQQYPSLICDVRGVGLFVGLELVTCPTTKTPAPLAAKTLKEGAKARGVLLTTDGPVGHVVKIKPPMVFGAREVDDMVQVMREVLEEMTAPRTWQQLLEAEQAHWVSHAEPILAHYSTNEQQVWALAAALQQQQQQADTEHMGATLQSLSLAETAAAAAAQPPCLASCTVGSTASLASEADCDIILAMHEAPAGQNAAKQEQQQQEQQQAVA